jgi:hypothetical protein
MKFFRLLLIMVFVFTAAIAHSQIGIRAGVNIATLNYDPDDFSDDVSSIIGLNIGLLMELPVTDRISLQPEIHFIQKGAKEEFDDFFGSGKITTTFNYLELAVMGKFNLLDIGNDGGLYLGLTPHLGYALSGETKFEENGFSDTEDIDFDEVSRIDFGIGFGAGATFGNFFLDIRYNLGLTNLNDSDFDIDINNRGLLIGVGYMF